MNDYIHENGKVYRLMQNDGKIIKIDITEEWMHRFWHFDD